MTLVALGERMVEAERLFSNGDGPQEERLGLSSGSAA
jgi:hypothetical protein